MSVETLPDGTQRSVWTQEDLSRLEQGPNYPHEYGPPSPRPPYSDTPGAEAAREAIRKYYRDQKAEPVVVKTKRGDLEYVAPGVEVPLEEVLKYTKDGDINRQSIIGKVASRLIEEGWQCKAGKSSKVTWIECAKPGHRVSVSGTDIKHNGQYVKEDELWSALT